MTSDASPPPSAFPATAPGATGSGERPPQATDRRRPDPPASTEGYALFLDVDGTLVEIAPRPEAVHVSEELVDLLGRLDERLQGAVALISGRAVSDLDALFAPLVLPAAGVHGLERRGADGVIHRAAAASLLDGLRRPLAAFAEARPGLLVEDKGQSLALHYRRAPACEAEAESFLRGLIEETASALELKRGKMVFEVRPGDADKGTAIAAFMGEPPFEGRTPVFIGDDVTDEDGFAIVNRLGGLSIRVGDDADSAATCRLADEQSVFAWLHAWIGDTPKEGPR